MKTNFFYSAKLLFHLPRAVNIGLLSLSVHHKGHELLCDLPCKECPYSRLCLFTGQGGRQVQQNQQGNAEQQAPGERKGERFATIAEPNYRHLSASF